MGGGYGIKDPFEVNFRNDYSSGDGQFLFIKFEKCQQDDCATKQEEIDEFFENKSFALAYVASYIDFEDVEAVDGHVKNIIVDIESSPLDKNGSYPISYKLIESQIEL